MKISEFRTLGSYPTVTEVVNYYLRSDILPEIFHVTQVRDVTFIYRESGGEKDVHIPLQPKDVVELENFLRRFFAQHEGQLEPYPWFTTYSTRILANSATGERRVIGWDSVIELDYGWRQSFGELKSGIQVLDDFGIHYRAKFSGHRSLHFILPAESMPEGFREHPDRERWSNATNKVGEFVITRSNYLRYWQKMGTHSVYSAPYTAHRYVGLVSIPLMPADYLKFRPWMATVHLAAPVPNWWDVPTQAGENFQKLLDYIESDRKVFDLQASITKEGIDTQKIGYIPGAISRAQGMAQPVSRSFAELHDEDVRVRRQALWTLMIQGTDAITELLKATDDEDKVVRWFALEAIRANIDYRYKDVPPFPKGHPSFLKASPFEKGGKGGIWGFGGFTDVNRVAEKLITDEDEYVRQAALDLFSEIGERGIARLLQLVMKDDASKPKQEAFWTLRDWVEAQGEAGIETLIQFVHGNDTELRSAALLVMGKTARLAAPELVELLSDADENIRIEALSALLEMGEGAVPFLKEAVESKQEPACMPREAESRTEAGLAQRALDGLERLRMNKDSRTLLPSLRIARLIAMGEKLALPMLSQQFKSVDKKTRFFAAKALSYIGQASVPIFIDSLSSSDANIRRRACEALRDISPPEARDALKKALTDVDVKVRQNAVRALARIGNPDDLEAIRPLLSDESRAVRKTVRETLKRET
jgi:HEAT repeat protein